MDQDRAKIHTKAIADVSKGGQSFRNSIVWEGNGGSDLPGARKSLPGRLHGNYKMNFIQDSFQRLSQKSKSTMTAFGSDTKIYCMTQKNLSAKPF